MFYQHEDSNVKNLEANKSDEKAYSSGIIEVDENDPCNKNESIIDRQEDPYLGPISQITKEKSKRHRDNVTD